MMKAFSLPIVLFFLALWVATIAQAAEKFDLARCYEALGKAGIQPAEGHGPPEKWPVDGIWAKGPYEGDFASLLKDLGIPSATHYFENFLKKRKAENKAHVLDLFGSGFFVDESSTSSITGLRWGPFDSTKLTEDIRPKKVPEEVLGDIFNPHTWEKLDESMHKRSIPSMDLIVMRPVGGWQEQKFALTVEGNVAALTFIIQNARKRLSPDGQFLFTIKTGQYLPLDLSQHPELQELARDVEEHSPFQLVLKARTNGGGKTYQVDGALVPKGTVPESGPGR